MSKDRGLNLTLPYYQAAPPKLVASTSSRNHSNHSLGGGISCIQPKTDKLTDKSALWQKDAAVVNSLIAWVLKPFGILTVPPPVHHLEAALKCEKVAKEDSYICNCATGFNRCISKLQDEIQTDVRI